MAPKAVGVHASPAKNTRSATDSIRTFRQRANPGRAAEYDPEFTPAGYAVPAHRHLAVGGIALFNARQRMSEILRIVPGSSLVVCASDKDLAAPEMAAGLEDTFGGGGYTALQRSALSTSSSGTSRSCSAT